ncbi:hypothetical protein [Lachnoanaerobaculum umeaense]|uniref:Uncharacterized protein n=1 Tax=Lachnoanaerobaculum umeaense TaxID=617123 RepID=A0A385Q296_9FIRM|nr:hypothetical protein [Lachnoanaerobaculum umeaense]AYB00463.1 hypothetical protein D4A81_11350 [Lachnoanaerobaculum umeaense]PZW98611.1 hypothetical protein C7439_10573 [Lachnoanaerobaculum umeaense]
MAENYYDKQIIPLKVRSSEAEAMSLDTGYYIEGRLETFRKEHYFDNLLSIYIPESFIDMPDEIKEIKYPNNFRPEIIKTNLAGDVNLSISLIKVSEDTEVKTLVTDFKNLLSKAHNGIKFLTYDELEKEGCVKMYCFDFIIPGIDERIYHKTGLGKIGRETVQVMFNCREPLAWTWKKAVNDILQNIKLVRK